MSTMKLEPFPNFGGFNNTEKVDVEGIDGGKKLIIYEKYTVSPELLILMGN